MKNSFYHSFLVHQLTNSSDGIPVLDYKTLAFNIYIGKQAFKQQKGHNIHSAIFLAELEKSIHYNQIEHIQQLISKCDSKQISSNVEGILKILQNNDSRPSDRLKTSIQSLYDKFEEVADYSDDFLRTLNKYDDSVDNLNFGKEDSDSLEIQKADKMFSQQKVKRSAFFIENNEKYLLPNPQTSQRSMIILIENNDYYTGHINTQNGIFEIFDMIVDKGYGKSYQHAQIDAAPVPEPTIVPLPPFNPIIIQNPPKRYVPQEKPDIIAPYHVQPSPNPPINNPINDNQPVISNFNIPPPPKFTGFQNSTQNINDQSNNQNNNPIINQNNYQNINQYNNPINNHVKSANNSPRDSQQSLTSNAPPSTNGNPKIKPPPARRNYSDVEF